LLQERVIKARQIIADSVAFGPEDIAIVTGAFDEAWSDVEGRFPASADKESVRLRMAEMVLEHAKKGLRDRARLKEIALKALEQ
jgi:hypothetical protein